MALQLRAFSSRTIRSRVEAVATEHHSSLTLAKRTSVSLGCCPRHKRRERSDRELQSAWDLLGVVFREAPAFLRALRGTRHV